MPMGLLMRTTRLAFVLATVALAGALSGPMPIVAPVAAQELETSTSPLSVTVIGQGRISVSPDAATFTVGVELEGTNLGELLARASDQMIPVIAALQAGGIAAPDIQTVTFRVEPLPRDQRPVPSQPVTDQAAEPAIGTPTSGDEPQRFRVANLVQVHVRDMSQLGTLIDDALAAGANTVFGVNFTVAESTELTSAAREAAFQDAQRAATEYAEISGMTLGRVLSITQESLTPVGPIGGQDAVGSAVPIQPGTTDVTVTVRVTFELIPSSTGGMPAPATPES